MGDFWERRPLGSMSIPALVFRRGLALPVRLACGRVLCRRTFCAVDWAGPAEGRQTGRFDIKREETFTKKRIEMQREAHSIAQGDGRRQMPPLSEIREDLHCIFCGTDLEADVNWFKHDKSKGRVLYACRDHESMASEPNMDKKGEIKDKVHHCRLCGTRLANGLNWDKDLSNQYVCVCCLQLRTNEFRRLHNTHKNKDLVKKWQRRAKAVLALDYASTVTSTEEKGIWDPSLLPPTEYMLAMYEEELQVMLAEMVKRHLSLRVKRECTIPGSRSRVDLVVEDIRLAIELKRLIPPDHYFPPAVMPGSERSPPHWTSIEGTTVKAKKALEQLRRYQDELDAHQPSTWKAVLVTPDGGLPGSLSCEELMELIYIQAAPESAQRRPKPRGLQRELSWEAHETVT